MLPALSARGQARPAGRARAGKDAPVNRLAPPGVSLRAFPEEFAMYRWARQVMWPHRRWFVPIALTGAAMALAVVAVLVFAGGGASGPTASPGTAAAPVASSGPSSTAPASTQRTGVSTASKPLVPQDPAEVATWKAGHGGTLLAAVSQQMGEALMNRGLSHYVQMRQACATLASTIAAAAAGPQIPDTAMQEAYLKALTNLAAGASACKSAISVHQEGDEDVSVHVSQASLDLAASKLALGAKRLYTATEKIVTIR
jgi:hypothetical protein